jgi:small-conductance mechanosensitive channel
MLVLGIAVIAALLIPIVTLGSYKRLIETKIHWGWFLAAGLAIQLVLEYVTLPHRYWDTLGYGSLVGSYVLILAFVGRNVVLRGMSIVFIGIACNAAVITLNQGMPVKFPPEWRHESWAKATVKHHPKQPGEKLLFLSDIIILKHPYDTIMSFGDLILAVGLCDVAYNASRNPRRRRKKARRAVARTAERP